MFRELIGDFNKNDIDMRLDFRKEQQEIIEENPLCPSDNGSNKEPDFDHLAQIQA